MLHNENSRVKIPALVHFTRLGYEYLSLKNYTGKGLIDEDTNIFIYPPYNFKSIDGLITNFHLPKSTLIMLVSAFAGKELIMDAYQKAIDEKYRFFSFGDAMFLK